MLERASSQAYKLTSKNRILAKTVRVCFQISGDLFLTCVWHENKFWESADEIDGRTGTKELATKPRK